jgi:threonine synthase
MAWPGVVERFRNRMDLPKGAPAVTLLEGNTPLIPLPRLAKEFGSCEIHIKYEGLNPTGSFKDRGMTAAVTVAAHQGAKALVCASTGNTAASAAAYAARCGMTCAVLVPQGKIAMGKLAGAMSYGAKVIQIEGSFDRALQLVREAAEKAPVALVNSVNPARLQGQKTASFETVEALGEAPEILALPIGNAGNISAYWMGFLEDKETGMATRLPTIIGGQAEGAAPLVHGHPIEHPETRATAIRIGNPARWTQATDALRDSGGKVLAVSDDEIFAMYRMLAETEGVFCEPSSAAGLAALYKMVTQQDFALSGERVVAILTGHGLKDPDSAIEGKPHPTLIEAELEALLGELSA